MGGRCGRAARRLARGLRAGFRGVRGGVGGPLGRGLRRASELESVLAVGALDDDGQPLAMSNWGPAYRGHGILAPGANILVASPGGRAIKASGTSLAFDEVVMEAVAELSAASEDASVNALAVGWAKDRAHWHRRLATTPVRASVVMADASNEISPLRVASDVLALQLRMRGLDVHTLQDTAIAGFRSIAERVEAEAVIFVGQPRDALDRRPIAPPTVAASFHADPVLLRTTALRLSPEPRLAADELCAALPHVSMTCDGASRLRRANGAGP